MFNFFLTLFTELLGAFDFTRPLCFLAMFVVIMLISSPGTIASIIALGTKLGIFLHIKEKRAS